MNDSLARPQPDLQEIIERTERELQNAHRTPFSDQALDRLKEEIAAYAVELINESVKRAKRHQAEGVSSADVQQASQYLVSSNSHKMYRHAGTCGGLLLGTALSNTLSMITTNQYSLSGVIITFGLTLTGTFLIATHIVKD